MNPAVVTRRARIQMSTVFFDISSIFSQEYYYWLYLFEWCLTRGPLLGKSPKNNFWFWNTFKIISKSFLRCLWKLWYNMNILIWDWKIYINIIFYQINNSGCTQCTPNISHLWVDTYYSICFIKMDEGNWQHVESILYTNKPVVS